ncbi:MAG TPA: hypothetical protein VGR96_11975 [Acidobacteriaceae bacterium]|nr:hypothetical protein [Acidobacteriaceae bacterium]
MKVCLDKLGAFAAAALLACTLSGAAQAAPSQAGPPQTDGPSPSPSAPTQGSKQPEPETHMTRQQAKELFRSVSEILTFASEDSQLPIRREVKRRLITREQVQKYVLDRFHEDKGAKRMEREEIVLKKFGLLDRDFHLQPFLVSLLTEQIAAFYDNKTRTVNLLDWVSPEEQKPVIAHELTHALQDQHTDLDKWEPDTPDKVSKTVAEDNQMLAIDERDTARDAVLEGQAMAVYMDYTLRNSGKTLRTLPDVGDDMESSDDSSPVMARAPKLLQESLLFPYRDGLEFEQTLLKDKGPQYAFAGVLDRPPSSSYEIMNARAYEREQSVPLLRMPDVHPLLDAGYEPYDIGVMGELDVKILAGLFGGEAAAAALTPQWNGGLYYVAQSKSAKTAEQRASTASLCLLYLSAWRNEASAAEFAKMYGRQIGVKYSGVERDSAAETTPDEKIYRTNEGPVLIVREGKQVFISESFDLDLARKLQFLLLGAQQGDATQIVATQERPVHDPIVPLVRFMSNAGVMKSALLH